jgi:hypothetical protein
VQPPDTTAQRPTAPEAVACNYCKASIIWAVTEKDGRMPVDAAPDQHGNVLLRATPAVVELKRPHAATVLAVVIGKATKRAAMRAHGVELRTHHRLSCPKASEWARGGAR